MRERTGRLVGRAVASVANLLDLRLVTVAGSVALGFGATSSPPPRRRWTSGPAWASPRRAGSCRAAWAREGPLVGAAAVAWRGLGRLPGFVADEVSR